MPAGCKVPSDAWWAHPLPGANGIFPTASVCSTNAMKSIHDRDRRLMDKDGNTPPLPGHTLQLRDNWKSRSRPGTRLRPTQSPIHEASHTAPIDGVQYQDAADEAMDRLEPVLGFKQEIENAHREIPSARENDPANFALIFTSQERYIQ